MSISTISIKVIQFDVFVIKGEKRYCQVVPERIAEEVSQRQIAEGEAIGILSIRSEIRSQKRIGIHSRSWHFAPTTCIRPAVADWQL
jgi:hypothetical protein